MRLAPGDEIAQSCWIVRRYRRGDRWAHLQRLAPAGELRLAGQDAEILDHVEDIEIAEDRAEGRIDEMEGLAVEPGIGLHPPLEPGEALGEILPLLLEGFPIRRSIEAPDIGKHDACEFDPGAMIGAPDRIGRMERR